MVVVKARNLKFPHEREIGDPFVKVSCSFSFIRKKDKESIVVDCSCVSLYLSTLRCVINVPCHYCLKVYLLQKGKKVSKKKSSTKRGEKNPIFNEAILFSVPAHALQVNF